MKKESLKEHAFLRSFRRRTDTDRSSLEAAPGEAELRMAIEAAELGIFDYYPLTGELHWSHRTKEHFGLSPEAHVNYNVFLVGLHPEDRDRVERMSGATAAGKQREIRNRIPDHRDRGRQGALDCGARPGLFQPFRRSGTPHWHDTGHYRAQTGRRRPETGDPGTGAREQRAGRDEKEFPVGAGQYPQDPWEGSELAMR